MELDEHAVGSPVKAAGKEVGRQLDFQQYHNYADLSLSGFNTNVQHMRAMQQAFGTNPADLVAGVGPCIGPCCYEVGTVVTTAVRRTFDNPDSLLISLSEEGLNSGIEARRFFDLPEANRRRLLASGVKQVELSGLCTACRTDLFFSHRAEKGRTGRFGALILLG